MNQKLIEGFLGAMMRMVPPEQWRSIVGEISQIREFAVRIDAGLKTIEELRGRIEFLESVTRNLDGAAYAFAEREAMGLAPMQHEVGGIPIDQIRVK